MMAFFGGTLIGLAGVLLLALNGRVLGVSGILGGILDAPDKRWRAAFLAGMFFTGFGFALFEPVTFLNTLERSWSAMVAAGLLVGFGTRLGGGCTSGHGICGMSRLSPRSIVATIVFMAAGAAVVFGIQYLGGMI